MRLIYLCLVILVSNISCKEGSKDSKNDEIKSLRYVHDTIGFAQHDWQLDSIYNRLNIYDVPNNLEWKAAISPHDDYKYAGRLYHQSLKGINAKNIILIGVAHRARNYNLQDKIIFGNFTHWQSPYGNLKVSSVNTDIMDKLFADSYVVHDSMQV